MMFGSFPWPCIHDADGIFSISIEREGGFFRYRRTCQDSHVEKTLISEGSAVFIHPVEPINLPKEVTRILEIVFPPVFIAPESEKTVFLVFPVEIGVFIEKNGDYVLLDVFSLCQPKYSLYGSPENGVITRFCQSRVSDTVPVIDPAREGVLQLTLRNTGRNWVEVSRAVFDSYFMPLYFDTGAAMTGEMTIFSKMIAETRLQEQPLRDGMTLAIPVIQARKILMVDVEKKSFLMEHGVG
ncbi:MAG: DUF432 domain-containing protein [Methanoregula sp.]|nr:DUF432 domain-containing protein [Methanoregula sp.]